MQLHQPVVKRVFDGSRGDASGHERDDDRRHDRDIAAHLGEDEDMVKIW